MSAALQPVAPGGTFSEIVAANVRAATARRGWSASDLARAIGLNRSALSYRWTGRRQWQLEDLDAVAQVLGTTPWALTQPAAGDEWEPDPVPGMENAPQPAGAADDGASVRPKGFEPPTF